MGWMIGLMAALVVLWAAHDILQKKHSILHNFPIVGHFRYWLEHIGPELRQYIVTSDNEERPFSRAQRRWVYASSKSENSYFGFGTSVDLEQHPGHVIIKHSAFPLLDPQPDDEHFDPNYTIKSHKVLGSYQGRKHAFRPESLVNLSGMSFGSLSGPAIEAINRGCAISGAIQNTGEGGISPHHQHGGDLMLQIGTGYFGCRDEQGRFSLEKLMEVVENNPVRALEIKLSQGAKPGVGGMLPAEKITPEISKIRGIPMGKDCASPASHREFDNVDSMLDFVELIAQATGLPVGIKSAVGDMTFWRDLAKQMATTNRGIDFVTIDGGEGGTGAAPRVFSDHVALPFKLGMNRVYREFVAQDLQEHVTFIGSGKLGFPEQALLAFGIGCDMISVAREAMLSIGCIQAQRCHTGFCPAGVATQNKWLMAGLDPTLKAARLANYVVSLRKEILRLCRACGVSHPAFITLDHFEMLGKGLASESAANSFGYGEVLVHDNTAARPAKDYAGQSL